MAADATGIREYKGAAKATTLVSGITNSSPSYSIADSTGWPTGAVGNFVITHEQGLSTEERVLCSALAGGVLTVVQRGYDNTTAVAHAAGSSVAHTISAVDIAEGNYIANFKSAPSKTTPVDADLVPLSDSASSGILKSLSWANIKVAIFTAIGALTGKTTPVDADTLAISDSAASSVGKSLTLLNLKKYILNSLTTAGDIFYATAAGVVARLAIGSTGNVLTVAGGVPTWAAPATNSFATGYNYVAGAETTTSTSYTGLTTPGAVTVTTGTKALVILNALSYAAAANMILRMGFAISGATTVAASDEYSLGGIATTGTEDYARASAVFLVTGLTAGSNVFTTQFKAGASIGSWAERSIRVIDMGS